MLGIIALGFLVSQFILYDINELSSVRSIVTLSSLFVISATSIIAGLLIRVDKKWFSSR